MNAYKYLHSRLGKVLETLKKDYLSGKHIVFLITSEPDVVSEVVASASVLPFRKKRVKDNVTEQGNVYFVNNDFMHSDAKQVNLEFPSLYVYEPESTAPQGSWQTPLVKYVRHCCGLSCLADEMTVVHRKKLQALQQSLILVILPEEVVIPSLLVPYSDVVVVPYMEKEEFRECVSAIVHELDGVDLQEDALGYAVIADTEYLDKLYHVMRGINTTQVKALLLKNYFKLGKLYCPVKYASQKDNIELDKLLKNIREESERIIASSAALQICEASEEQPAGLQSLLVWLDQHKSRVKDPLGFSRYILGNVKGILLSGIPGSGKSMMAKHIAYLLGLSLIKMDLGDVLGGYVGDSEKNMNKAFCLVEALSPCVLWVDEIEKAFAGASGSNGHEVTKRLVGKFLTWMQEKKASCFVFATANDVSMLPPEMFRSGRFDEKFYTFMPTCAECGEIFESIIFYQCMKYRELQGKDSMKRLFDEQVVNADMMKNLLNRECIVTDLKPEDAQVVRSNKFLTGSDIASLIEKAKTLYLFQEYPSSKSVEFESTHFMDCLKKALQEMRTYGETNLEDIARCYATLVKNNFVSASENILMPFGGYDKLRYVTAKEGAKVLYKLEDEKRHLTESCASKYDKQMYLVLRNTINMMANVLATI